MYWRCIIYCTNLLLHNGMASVKIIIIRLKFTTQERNTYYIYIYIYIYISWSIIRSFPLYTQHWYMSYRLQLQLASRVRTEPVPSWSCSQAVSKPVWNIQLLCVQWKTPDDEQRNSPKHLEFYSKNKCEKLVHLVGYIIRIPVILVRF